MPHLIFSLDSSISELRTLENVNPFWASTCNGDENEEPFHNSDDSDKDPNYLSESDSDNSSKSGICDLLQPPEMKTLQGVEEVKKTRKRMQNKSEWKKNAAKLARNSGEPPLR